MLVEAGVLLTFTKIWRGMGGLTWKKALWMWQTFATLPPNLSLALHKSCAHTQRTLADFLLYPHTWCKISMWMQLVFPTFTVTPIQHLPESAVTLHIPSMHPWPLTECLHGVPTLSSNQTGKGWCIHKADRGSIANVEQLVKEWNCPPPWEFEQIQNVAEGMLRHVADE